MNRITIEFRPDTFVYVAYLTDVATGLAACGAGPTKESALGDLIMRRPEYFGLSVTLTGSVYPATLGGQRAS